MISRHWTGLCKATQADEYVQYLRSETFAHLKTLDGFIKAEIHQREITEGIEYLIITFWQSSDAIKSFAGALPNVAVVPKVVHDVMVTYDKYVRHYEVYNV